MRGWVKDGHSLVAKGAGRISVGRLFNASEMEHMVALSRLAHFFKQRFVAFEAGVVWVRQAVGGIG